MASRTIARASTTPAAAPKACTMRHASMTSILGASAQPKLAREYNVVPARRTGLRPKRSESGPWTSIEAA